MISRHSCFCNEILDELKLDFCIHASFCTKCDAPVNLSQLNSKLFSELYNADTSCKYPAQEGSKVLRKLIISLV